VGGQTGSDQPLVVQVDQRAGIAEALNAVSIGPGQPVIVLVGGAGGMDDDDVQSLEEVLRRAVLPVIEECRAAVIDGGTDSGVMRAVGHARSRARAVFPLVGVASRGTVALPGASSAADAAAVDQHHTHLLLVPGTTWGDEGPWLADVADVLAGDRPSATLLANGGDIAFDDAGRSLERGRPVIVLAGTGRSADAIADAAAGRSDDPRALRVAHSCLTRVVPVDDLVALRMAVSEALGAPHGSSAARDEQVDTGGVAT
jgi:hypothetical protein